MEEQDAKPERLRAEIAKGDASGPGGPFDRDAFEERKDQEWREGARRLLREVIILPEAKDDLGDIYDDMAGRWGPDQAIRYNRKLRERIEGLGTGRTASPPADGVLPGLRRALAERHAAFFREAEGAVVVVRGLHQRMDVG